MEKEIKKNTQDFKSLRKTMTFSFPYTSEKFRIGFFTTENTVVIKLCYRNSSTYPLRLSSDLAVVMTPSCLFMAKCRHCESLVLSGRISWQLSRWYVRISSRSGSVAFICVWNNSFWAQQ